MDHFFNIFNNFFLILRVLGLWRVKLSRERAGNTASNPEGLSREKDPLQIGTMHKTERKCSCRLWEPFSLTGAGHPLFSTLRPPPGSHYHQSSPLTNSEGQACALSPRPRRPPQKAKAAGSKGLFGPPWGSCFLTDLSCMAAGLGMGHSQGHGTKIKCQRLEPGLVL